MAAVGDGSAFGIKTTYIPQHAPLGLAHAVQVARDFLADDDFIMYLGDNFIVGGIAELVDAFRQARPAARIMLTQVPEPARVRRRRTGRRRAGSSGWRRSPSSRRAISPWSACTCSPRPCTTSSPSSKPSWRGELEITEAIQMLIDSGQRVESSLVTGYWKDTGNVADMLEVNRMVLETAEPACRGEVDAESELIGRVVIEDGARVQGSRIVGPAIIGADSQVTGSYVGPFTSVGAGCLLADSEIEYSIVLAGASICGVRRIEASLIGRGVEITPAPRVPKAHRLVLGDHSKVQISS